MHSWKYKKLRDEKCKARRKLRSRIAKLERVVFKYPDLRYTKDIPLNLSFRQRMAEKLQSISFRNIFKRK